jgi:hypothetical protein
MLRDAGQRTVQSKVALVCFALLNYRFDRERVGPSSALRDPLDVIIIEAVDDL